jgi:hypothetical protein
MDVAAHDSCNNQRDNVKKPHEIKQKGMFGEKKLEW